MTIELHIEQLWTENKNKMIVHENARPGLYDVSENIKVQTHYNAHGNNKFVRSTQIMKTATEQRTGIAANKMCWPNVRISILREGERARA